MIKYTVCPIDTLYSIAMQFGITCNSLLLANPNIDPINMIPGTTLIIPLNSYRDITYNILGTTNEISETQMNNIVKWRKFIVEFVKNHPNEVYINGLTNKKLVSITFDDGPDSSVTPGVLDILKKNNVKANFFFVGKQINFFPSIVKRAFNEGHLILNHSWSHPYFTEINTQSVKKEIVLTEERIESIIGRKPAIARPPYGAIDEKALSAIKTTNNKVVIWSIDSMDWVRNEDKYTIVKNILSNVRPGDIVLMHSSMGHYLTVEVLQEIIDGLKEKHFEIVDLGVMLNINPYK